MSVSFEIPAENSVQHKNNAIDVSKVRNPIKICIDDHFVDA